MKVYPVTDSELTSLEDANTHANVFGSAATTFFGLGAGLLTDSMIEAPNTDLGKLLLTFGPPVLCLIGAVFFVLWFLGLRKRWSIIKTVRASAVEASIVRKP